MTSYRVSDSQTDIERFENEENAVVIKWTGESKQIETYTRGYSEPLYVGTGLDAARESLELTQEQWDSLLFTDVEYLEEV